MEAPSKDCSRTDDSPQTSDPNDPDQDWTTMAIVERSGSMLGTIGIACLNVSTCTLYLNQFEDDKSYSKLKRLLDILKPKKILLPNEMGEEKKNIAIISEMDNTREVCPCDRKTFSIDIGVRSIKDYAVEGKIVVEIDLKGKQACLSAAGGLFEHFMGLETMEVLSLTHKSLKVNVGSDNTMFIDLRTSRSLELLNSLSGNWKESLFGFVNFTKTKAGMMLLKTSILEPSKVQEDITERLDAVQELLENPVILDAINAFLKTCQVNLGLSASYILRESKSRTEKALEDQINAIVFIRHALQCTPVLVEAFSESKCKKLQDFHSILRSPEILEVVDEIRKYITDAMTVTKGSLNFKTQKIFAVLEDLDDYLKIQRVNYGEIMQDVLSLVEQVNLQLDLPSGSVKSIYQVNRGFCFEVATVALEGRKLFPGMRILLSSQNARYTRFTFLPLEMLNQRLDASFSAIIKISHGVLGELILFLKDKIKIVHDMTDVIAEVDLLASLATTAQTYGLTRPSLGNKIRIKNGKHPIFMKMLRERGLEPVANDTLISDSNSISIIMGSNMSGKSCYIRQVALITILAQIGSFIPADEESMVRVTDQIFTRIGSDDDDVTNSSTFTQEVMQVRYIMEKVTPDSLVIIDELGRGTSVEGGTSLCVLILEELAQKECFVLFATHFLDISAVESLYPEVYSFKMKTEDTRDEAGRLFLKFTHQLILLSKACQGSGSYGIDLAEVAGLDTRVVKDARHLLSEVSR